MQSGWQVVVTGLYEAGMLVLNCQCRIPLLTDDSHTGSQAKGQCCSPHGDLAHSGAVKVVEAVDVVLHPGLVRLDGRDDQQVLLFGKGSVGDGWAVGEARMKLEASRRRGWMRCGLLTPSCPCSTATSTTSNPRQPKHQSSHLQVVVVAEGGVVEHNLLQQLDQLGLQVSLHERLDRHRHALWVLALGQRSGHHLCLGGWVG